MELSSLIDSTQFRLYSWLCSTSSSRDRHLLKLSRQGNPYSTKRFSVAGLVEVSSILSLLLLHGILRSCIGTRPDYGNGSLSLYLNGISELDVDDIKMPLVVTRVDEASVVVDEEVVGSINKG
eukprot:GHVH01011609.1.p1 GENE.GHVH01011609.1~~GHVH01011609.1.p1  ORF type:complete len:123 (+),score=9.64 GHVH01011609.1:216-584(+)